MVTFIYKQLSFLALGPKKFQGGLFNGGLIIREGLGREIPLFYADGAAGVVERRGVRGGEIGFSAIEADRLCIQRDKAQLAEDLRAPRARRNAAAARETVAKAALRRVGGALRAAHRAGRRERVVGGARGSIYVVLGRRHQALECARSDQIVIPAFLFRVWK